MFRTAMRFTRTSALRYAGVGAGAATAAAAFTLTADDSVAHAASRLPSRLPSPYGQEKPRDLGTISGEDYKAMMHAGQTQFGLFCNSASPTMAEHVSSCGYDFVLVDTQHGPMNPVLLSTMLCAIAKGGAKSMVRVAAFDDRAGIQQALDLGADGVLVPYVNNAEEVEFAVSCAMYPTKGTRSVYFPQRSMFEKGLLGYAGNSNKNVIIAMQIETADSIKNMESIAQVEGVDMLFLGRNDLCMSMGLYEKYEFPHMYSSPELAAAQTKLVINAKRNGKLLGLFLFGTEHVPKFIDMGFSFISVGNDLHHILTSAQGHIDNIEKITAENRSVPAWKHRDSNMVK